MSRAAPILVALVAVAAVVVPYLALGGASYEPTPVADPCRTREWRDPGDVPQVVEQVVLSALDGAACELGASREELLLALEDEQSLAAFAAEHGISASAAEQAVGDGLVRAVDDAEEAGVLSGLAADLVRGAVERVEPRLVLDLLEQLRTLLGVLT
ncbi:MAG TPA: hypothetical protein VK874_15425 [Gaiellaceae bacterium]|nr:hypothetical protein [Gaiellaceae bacterium]